MCCISTRRWSARPAWRRACATQFGFHANQILGLLASAVNAPFQSFGGVELYPTLTEKAARLCYGLAKNHPFFDGNKRTALHSMLVFLAVNGCPLEEEADVLRDVIIDVAAGDMAPEELAHWLAVKVQHREMEGMWHG